MSSYDEDTPIVKPTVPKGPTIKAETQYIDDRTQLDVRASDVGNYHSALVNTRYVDVSSLLTHIGGSSLTVDYFSGVMDTDDEATHHSESQAGAYQQYVRVIALEIKIQTPINPNDYNAEQGEFSGVGVGTIYAGVIPNKGDPFIADIGDGRLAQLSVTESPRPMSYLKSTVYEIKFSIVKFITDDTIESLTAKSIATYYFDVEDIRNGGSGLLSAVQVDAFERTSKAINTLATYHLSTFHDPEIESLVFTEDTKITYDPFIPGVMRDILPLDVLSGLPRNRELNCDNPDSARTYSLWDVLVRNNIQLLPIICTGYEMKSVNTFTENPQYGSVMYSGAHQVMMPSKHMSGSTPKALTSLQGLLDDTPMPSKPTTDKVDMHPLHHGGYVLSSYFYTQDHANMSRFEMMVIQYLEGKVINADTLYHYIKEVLKWSTQQQFYLIPVLLILSSVVLRQRSVN